MFEKELNIEQSLLKKKTIFKESIWDKFHELGGSILFLILAVPTLFMLILTKGLLTLIISFSVLLIFVLLIVTYIKINNLKKVVVKSFSGNRKLIKQFSHKEGWEILISDKTKTIISIPNSRYDYGSETYLFVIYNQKNIWYNCITFTNNQRGGVNFKSPFYWFYNKKVEKKLANYIFKVIK